jgi:hypothetical protein
VRRGRRIILALVLIVGLPACAAMRVNEHPVCDQRPTTVLMAESVPNATLIPCVRSLPLGWAFSVFDARQGISEFSLDSDAGGPGALLVRFMGTCRPEGTQSRSDEPGTRMVEHRTSQDPYAATWSYLYPGGCARYSIHLAAGAPVGRLLGQIRSGLSFIGREQVLEGLAASELEPAGA